MKATEIKFSPINIEKRKQTDIRTGDTVRVSTKIVEKGKTRLQPFEGLVIARKHGTEPGATFTVRRTTGGYGVEKIFPLYSPNIEKIEILRRSKVRQSNIYHVRRKVARAIRREMRRMQLMDELVVSSDDQEEPTDDTTSDEPQSSADQSASESSEEETTAQKETGEENTVTEKPEQEQEEKGKEQEPVQKEEQPKKEEEK